MSDSTAMTVSWWVCARCSTHNPAPAPICTNPMCGGEPVSRTVDAVSSPAFVSQRQCLTRDGVPKIAYQSFDAAHDVVLATASSQRRRVHAYRCADHGWHVGSNQLDAA
jgi:hypothetical protein